MRMFQSFGLVHIGHSPETKQIRFKTKPKDSQLKQNNKGNCQIKTKLLHIHHFAHSN